ncbi:MAG TPA: hypothetical protein VKE74_13935 [Gemmataceae bacterium]|nr:hypothetical protein [Gemmataceae bacterium]
MTTLAKIEANQHNAVLSTGPRTAEGKATVARNATRHGIFSAVPVIPGESPEQWEAHRAGVVASLTPVGLLEVNLAERAALLLWRLQRLARYEAETVAAGMEEVDVPPLPPPVDAFDLDPPPKQKTRDEQLRDIRRELRTAREELAQVVPGRDYLRSPPDAGSTVAVPFSVAEGKHPRTGLHKVRIDYAELMELSAEGVRKLAAAPRPFEPTARPVGDIIGELEHDWSQTAARVTREQEGNAEQKAAEAAAGGPDRLNRATLDFIADGAGVGDRHRLLFSAAANLAEFG